jgi:hypothetical protein
MPYPFAEARISHELGCLVAEQGEVKHSSALLERALTIFQQVGARPYFERTQHALRALPAAR